MKSDNSGYIIIHSKRDDPFSRVSNEVLGRSDMSAKAKGVFAYLIGKPVSWRINVRDVRNHMSDGKTSVQSALHELRCLGYCNLEIKRNQFGEIVAYVYFLSDTPAWENSPENVKLRESYIKKYSKTKRPKKFLIGFTKSTGKPASFNCPETENQELDNGLTEKPVLESEYLSKKELYKEGALVRKTVQNNNDNDPAKPVFSNEVSLDSKNVKRKPNLTERINAELNEEYKYLTDKLPDLTPELKQAVNKEGVMQLLHFWNTNYPVVFGRAVKKFTEADVLAAEDIIENSGLEIGAIKAVITLAWGKKSSPGRRDRFYACVNFSFSLAMLGTTHPGYAWNWNRIVSEIDWRDRMKDYTAAHTYLQEAKRRREETVEEVEEAKALLEKSSS